MSDVFKVVLLHALPASGKSEVRNFMANIDAEELKRDFHIGENLQLDDFPYVHFMRCIDNELDRLGKERLFYQSNDDPFINNYDWATLGHLLNEDYHDLINCKHVDFKDPVRQLFSRIDASGQKSGIESRLSKLDDELLDSLYRSLEAEALEILKFKDSQITDDLTDKTIVIEAARGGHDGAEAPLEDPFGYQYSLRIFSDELLKDAVLLYIWVTPEESRRKNFERANPDDPGSNLFHGVPLNVMMHDYGTDDMMYLMEHSEVENSITVVKDNGNKYHLPVGVFDNRVDQTSFLRLDKKDWPADKVETMIGSIRKATDTMYEQYRKNK